MNWRLQTTLAGILAALGLWITFNPITVVSAAGSVIPWLLLAAGAVQLVSILFRSRRLIRLIIVPAVTGALFVYAGLSMKFGDPKTVGPISLVFVLALVFFGSGAAKLFTAASVRRSRYSLYILGSGAISVLMGLVVLFNWQTVSDGLIGVFLGVETLADAVVMAVLGLRERDGEAAMETLGLDPAAEAAKAEAKRAAAAAEAAAEAATIKAAMLAAEAKAAAAVAATEAAAVAATEAAAAAATEAAAAAATEAAALEAAAAATAMPATVIPPPAPLAVDAAPPAPKPTPKRTPKAAAAPSVGPAAPAPKPRATPKKAAPKPPKPDPETLL
jgi:membrane protein HdeD